MSEGTIESEHAKGTRDRAECQAAERDAGWTRTLQATAPFRQRWVRVALYGSLLAIALAAGWQAWQAAQAEAARKVDAELITLAGHQRMQSQRIGRLAALATLTPRSSPVHLAELQQSQAAMQQAAQRMDALIAQQRAASRLPSDSVASLLSRVSVQQESLWENATYVAKVDAEMMPPIALGLQAEAEAFLRDMDALAGELQAQADARSQRAAESNRHWVLLMLGLLTVLAVAVLEPLVRMLRRQQGRLVAQAEETRYLALAAQRTGNGVVFTDREHRIVWINEGFTRLSGYALHEVAGRTPGEVLGSERTPPATVERMLRAIASREAIQVEVCNRAKDGSEYWIGIDMQPLHDEQGAPAGFVEVQSDITERLLQRQHMAKLIEVMPVGMLVYDAEGRVTECNPAACRIGGLSAEEALGRHAHDARWQSVREDGSDLPPEAHAAQVSLRTGQPVSGSVQGLRLPDGGLRWVSIDTQPLLGLDGSVEGVVSCVVDLTEKSDAGGAARAGGRRRRAGHLGGRASERSRPIQRSLGPHARLRAAGSAARQPDLAPAGSPGRSAGRRGTARRAPERPVGGLPDRTAHAPPRGALGLDLHRRRRGRARQRRPAEAPGRRAPRHRPRQARRGRDRRGPSACRECAVGASRLPGGARPARRRHRDRRLGHHHARQRSLLSGQPVQSRRAARPDAPDRQLGHPPEGSSGPTCGATSPAAAAGAARCATRRAMVRCTGSTQRSMPVLDENGTVVEHVAIRTDITQRKQLEEQLRSAALTDELTQLPNRVSMLEKLHGAVLRARRLRDYHFAVLFMDFDRFKLVNDSLGHDVGDELLRQIAQRLRLALREGDTLSRAGEGTHTAARIGGDEFVILLDGIRGVEDAELVARRLLLVLSQPYQIGAHEVHSSASIGVVASDTNRGDADALLRDADTAMYEAKRAGRGRYVLFDATMHERVARTLDIENDLRRALQTDEFFVVYQPIVDLETGQPARRRGAGALAAPAARPGAAAGVHPDRRGDGAHQRARRSRAERSLRPVHALARHSRRRCADQRRGEPVARPAPPERPDRDGASRVAAQRHAAAMAAPRSDRKPGHAGQRGAGRAAPAQGPGREPGAGRLRHRLLVARLPARDPGRRAQDRPLVRQPARDRATTAAC